MKRKKFMFLVASFFVFILMFSQRIESADQISNQLPTFSATSVSVVPSVGSVAESVNITVPNGRAGIQPNLSLNYNSSVKQGLLGVGWLLELGHIERSTKRGIPKYNDTDSFLLVSNGTPQELIFDSTVGYYRPKIEGEFSKIQKLDNQWLVTDKSGIKYHFGATDDSQQYNAGQPSNVFQWFLNKVEDIHGNYMTFTYVKDNNQVYPKSINYTGNQVAVTAPFAQVEFVLEARNTPHSSYSAGFLIKTLKRISKIIVKAENIRQSEYELVYSSSQSTNKDLLVRINQYASDGTTKLPPKSFSYSFNDKGFVDDSSQWSIPSDIVFSQMSSSNFLLDLGVRIEDVNSDGYPDILMLRRENAGSIRKIYINNKNRGWIFDSSWTLPEVCTAGTFCTNFIYNNTARTMDLGLRPIDVNGDNRLDFILKTEGTWVLVCQSYNVNRNEAYINTGTNWSSDTTNWYLPSGSSVMQYHRIYCPPQFKTDITVDFLGTIFSDLNNDGYIDIIKSANIRSTNYRSAYLNAMASGGTGWSVSADFTPPADSLASFTNGAQLVDLNGDGLPDIYYRVNGTAKTYMNTGAGWLEDPSSPWNNTLGGYGNIQDGSTQFGDINGDGLADMIIAKGSLGNGSRVFINTGYGWMQDDAWVPTNADFTNLGSRLLDADSDGMLDFMVYPNGQSAQLYINKGSPADLLVSTDNGIGGKTDIEYDSATHFANTFLPFSFPVAKTMTISDTFSGDSFVTTYQYAQALWNAGSREFRGFGYVKVTDPDGNYMETQFMQDEFMYGRVVEQRMYASNGVIQNKTINSWNGAPVISGVKFVNLRRQDHFVYDEGTLKRRVAEEFYYQETTQLGNLTKKLQLGEVDLATGNDIGNDNDNRSVEIEYVNNTSANNWLIGLPRITVVKNNAGQIIRKTWFYYDNQANTAMPIKGLLTKKEDWAGDEIGVINPTTQYVYDEIFGNLLTTVDPKGNPSSVTYDPIYKIFPLESTDALGHKFKNEYYGVNGVPLVSPDGLKGLWGQLKSTTDPNQQQGKRSYDVFGRLITIIDPLDSLAFPTQTTSVEYRSNHVKVTSRQRIKKDQPQMMETVMFSDGLGRVIQTKTPTEVAGQFTISGQVEYNSRGLVSKQYLPYFSTNPVDFIEPIISTRYGTTTVYDALGRVVRTINADDSYSTVEYKDWSTITINENGHKQASYFDAYGRLIKKEEYKGADGRAQQYYPATPNYTLYATTLYAYNSEGNLTKTTDSYGNITTVTYDALGRKKVMIDPDMGRWTYEYDLNGNLWKQTDAKGNTITFTYDALNRLINKSDGGSLNVTYTYDNASPSNFAKGRLTQATYTGGNTQFSYDELGRELQSIKSINTTSYGVNRSYDALNNLLQIQYPDQKNIYYKYNSAGQTEAISNDPTLLGPQSSLCIPSSIRIALANEPEDKKQSSPSWVGQIFTWIESNLLGVNDAYAQAASQESFKQPNNSTAIVAIETENYHANVPPSGGSPKWDRVTTTGQSGTGSMKANPNTGVSNDTNYTTASPRLDYKIKFVKTGIHYVWIRGIATTAGDDSVHLGFDGQAVATADKVSSFTTSWKWSKTTLDASAPATINVATAGEHTLNIWMQEDGFVIDKILITTSATYTPSGAGPPENAQFPPATAPLLNSPVAGTANVSLSWSAVSGATGYRVHRGSVSGSYAGTGTDVGSARARTITGLSNGTKYYFVVSAYNSAGSSIFSNEVTATPIAAPILNAPVAADKQVTLSWNAAAGATGYKIYYGTAAGQYGSSIPVGNTTTTTVTGLTNGTTYYFAVSGTNPSGESLRSNELSAVPTAPVLAEDPTLFVKNVNYNASGQIVMIEYGNGNVTEYTYNERTLRLTRLYTKDKNNTPLQDLKYTYDPAGNIVSITDDANMGDQTFEYDELGRLVKATGQRYGTKIYEYDQIGNIVKKDGKTYFYDGINGGPHAVTAICQNGTNCTNIAYDANGNMETKVEAGVTTTYFYDTENRLTKVQKGGNVIAQYEYDGDGGRTKKIATVSGQTTTTTYIGSLLETVNGQTTKFIFLGEQRVAAISNSLSQGTKIIYYHSDHLGSANIITNANGSKKELIEYDPFGKSYHEKYDSSPEVAWYYFNGKPKDDETGLYYYGGRYYDSLLGRFITADTIIPEPANPQSFNRYSYVYNNPINYIDPSGHFAWLAFFAGLAKMAGVVSQIATVVSLASTAVGLITQNQTLLNIGRIAGYVGLGTGLMAGGISSVVAAKATSSTQLASSSVHLDTIYISLGKARMAGSAHEVLQNAITSSIGSLVSSVVATVASIGSNVASAASYWAYESAVPGPFGQPLSQWRNGSPTSWGDPVEYTERAGGAWMWVERAALTVSVGATAGAGGAMLFDAGASSIFYSGQGSMQAALNAAGNGFGRTILNTPGGRALTWVERFAGRPLPQRVWRGASDIFARNAKGVARSFLNSPRSTSTYRTVEEGILHRRGIPIEIYGPAAW